MAVKSPPEAEATAPATGKDAAKKKGSKKKLIIIVLVVVLVGGGAYKTVLAPKKVGPPAGGDIVSLEANTLNLSDGHYLKIGVDIQLVKGKAAVATFQMSQAQELVINEFSDRTVASLSTNAARLALMNQLDTSLKQAYKGEIFKTFLTQFVTQ
jgi:flagellar FliL protein